MADSEAFDIGDRIAWPKGEWPPYITGEIINTTTVGVFAGMIRVKEDNDGREQVLPAKWCVKITTNREDTLLALEEDKKGAEGTT